MLASGPPDVARANITSTRNIPPTLMEQDPSPAQQNSLHPSSNTPNTSEDVLRLIEPNHSRDGQSQRLPMDIPQPAEEALLKAKSVYLDSQTWGTTEFDTLQKDAPISEPGAGDTPKPGRRKQKISKAEKMERIAAEHAVWVRDVFDLPGDEGLVASFSAALVKHILLQGKIHITTSAICFYAKIFGRITKECYPFSTISRVKKRKGGFVANAIKIYFLDPNVPPVVIGSLNQRERAFGVIQGRLKEVNPAAAQPRDGDDNCSATSLQGDSEDRSIEDDEYNQDSSSRGHGRRSDENAHNRVVQATDIIPSGVRKDVNIRPNGSDTASEPSSRKSSDHDVLSRPELTPSDPAPELVWRTPDDIVDASSAHTYAKKTERARSIMSVPVIEAFNVLFVSDWLRHYHDVSNNKDLTMSPWSRNNDGYMTRELTFRRPLGYKIGPKETRVVERQKYSFTSDGGVLIELQGQNLDAPYADYFVAESFFELKPHGDGSTTLFIASIAVHFFKSTILRGKIESGALAETKTAYQRLMNLASARVEEYKASRPSSSQKHKRSGEEEIPGLTIPSSPNKKLRSLDNTAVPSLPEPLTPSEKTVDAKESRTLGSLVHPAESISGSIEVRDSETTKWLRILGVGALIFVCILLLAVIVLLYKMQNNVTALEKLVTESVLKGGNQCEAAGSCGAGAVGP
eukprot:GFKZ01006843.1.p1 GENE.GFKZ01006843.1~~GFKZ01006843.1.p1  ORF type:complete len:687 (+),score=86.62 GFKZ01006843.1:360-2420(+)